MVSIRQSFSLSNQGTLHNLRRADRIMDLPRESKPLRGWRIDGKVRKTNDRSPKYQKDHQKLGHNAQRWWHGISVSFRGKGHSRIIYRNIFSSAYY